MDFEALMQEAQEIAENGGGTGEFREVPAGEYEAAIEKMEIKKSKKGSDMLSIWFTILDGDYANNKLFFNQVLTNAFGLHKANEMLRSLKSDQPVTAKSLDAYTQLVNAMFEELPYKHEYLVKYTPNAKDTIVIADVFNI
ncbi:MAG: hypothetical protein K0S71_590 [Clostridia bacterium]|jgi:uncharacterized protein (DUF2225 family)|nr:hypothetical protein [Clostridia bacterium]